MEIELKLLLDPPSRGIVERHPVLAAADHDGEPRQEITTYFDTPDFALRRHGATLRVRRSGFRFIQTVKLQTPGAGLGVRGEWEWPVASADPEPAKLASLPQEAGSVRDAMSRVHPIFTTEIKRKVWRVELDPATSVEAVLDEGIVQAGARRSAICEIELELKRGSAAALFQLAIDLCDRAGLRYGPQSKAERGYALACEDLPPLKPDRDFLLPRKATLAESFPQLVSAALRDLADEIPSAAARNIEGVHRMRAAIRKLRTLLVLFAPYLDRAAADRFNAVLRDLGRVLGQGRDWDVFLTETLPKAELEADGAGLELLRLPAQARSDQAHEAIALTVQSPLLTRLILGLGAWTVETGWLRHADPNAPLRDLLLPLLTRLERKARRRARHHDESAVEHLHDLRKALKKLRYSVEDVGPLFQHKGVRRYLKAIKGTLTLLGEINDAAVTVERVGDAAPADRPELAAPAGALLRWNERRRAKALRKLDHSLSRLFKEKAFWS